MSLCSASPNIPLIISQVVPCTISALHSKHFNLSGTLVTNAEEGKDAWFLKVTGSAIGHACVVCQQRAET